MCGKVRHAVGAVASGCDFVVAQGTEGGGHTGTVATMALVPQVVDAVGDKVPVVAAGGLFDGRGPGRLAGARRRRRVDRHPVHRHPRGAAGGRLQGDAAAPRPRTAPSSSGPTPARPAGSCATTGPTTSSSTPTSCSRSRSRPSPRAKAGANHLGRPDGTEVDVSREFMPCGQGVGAIDELVPAGDIVRTAWSPRPKRAIDRIASRARDEPRPTAQPTTSTGRGPTTSCPTLHDYIRIPNVSPAFDPEWDAHGHMDAGRRADRARLVRARAIAGLTVEVHELPGRTPADRASRSPRSAAAPTTTPCCCTATSTSSRR